MPVIHPDELEGLSVEIDDVVYMPSIDAPADRPHPFVYFITIRNDSSERVSIKARKWVVTEADGEKVVVEGDGVVGQYPVLKPGETFRYNSYHVVRSDSRAQGSFFGATDDGQIVRVRIPDFEMVVPELE